ncbi:MAG: FecR domain-containing protein, partial [Myxococcales bacterium]|nr:FecR domain-containing protein [Myxococcales bacterium]
SGQGVFVETTAGWTPVVAGAALPARAHVRTDARTRAWLTLADGSTLTLDHGTELALDDARGLVLSTGRLVADVVHVDGAPPVRFVTARGTVEVLGPRFLLTAGDDLTSVRVARGAVRLAPPIGAPVEVRAGEEGSVGAGAAEVAAVPSLAADLAWAELREQVPPQLQPDTTTTTADAGLGALRAYKPGEHRDRDWELTLADHQVRVRIVGPIARTEITETFRNDTDQILEGVYRFPLPADARIDGLALDAPGGGFHEGAFVDRERASRIWNGVIDKATPKSRRRPQEIIWVPGPWRDPALLEWQNGGRFELRVFPIPAHGARTIKIAYQQVVAPHGAQRRYVYPLPHSTDGSTAAEHFAVDLEVKGVAPTSVTTRGYDAPAVADGDDAAVRYDQGAFVPRGDLIVDYRPADGAAELRAWTFAGGAAAAPDDRLAAKKGVGVDPAVVAAQRDVAADARPAVVFALRPTLPRWTEQAARDLIFVVDASQSMVGERHGRAVELNRALIGELDRRDRFTVLACDDTCRSLGAPRAPTAQAATE